MHPILNVAIKAARRAGAVIARASLDPGAIEVRAKRVNDFVTQVDKAAETSAIDIIRKAYPGHGILAEESGENVGGADNEHVWIIDPLDGTTNFIHGFPHYCVSIGVQHRGTIAHGVIYDPNRNELFTATRGSGAFLNDRRLRVTKCLRLADALVATGFPFKELSRLDIYMRQLKTLMGSCAGVRRAGSAALDLAYVAAGRCDAFWELGLSKWDMAAGALLIQEAGGLVTDPKGEPNYMESGDIVAGTPKVFSELLDALR
ncbi:MAG: inositol monophosphatase [Betaproteobacteria bacterium]|nr:inositol monophosphatase [Betaproteobacteria bacterium]